MSEQVSKKRVLDLEMLVAATPEQVWKALTDSEELSRWFPLSAKVKPGAGGTIFLSWGPGWEGEAPISVWEPENRFTWQEGAPRHLSLDWTLEARGGKTLVRVVQSGFDAGTAEDDEFYGSIDYGWKFMLTNLRHYLERHNGTPRQVAWPRRKVVASRGDAYARLAGANGIFVEDASRTLKAGANYALRTTTGETFNGRVEFVSPPRGFCVSVDSLNDALFWLTIEGAQGNCEAQIWLSAYGISQNDVEEFGRRWAAQLSRIFPEPSA